MSKRNNRPFAHRRPALLALVGALVLACALWVAGAPASDLQSKLDQKKTQLAHTNERAGSIGKQIEPYFAEDIIAGRIIDHPLKDRPLTIHCGPYKF